MALGGPAGLVPDIAGPRTYELEDLVRSYLGATHRHRLVVPVRIPGGPPEPSGPAPTSPRNTPSADEPGRSSWPTDERAHRLSMNRTDVPFKG